MRQLGAKKWPVKPAKRRARRVVAASPPGTLRKSAIKSQHVTLHTSAHGATSFLPQALAQHGRREVVGQHHGTNGERPNACQSMASSLHITRHVGFKDPEPCNGSQTAYLGLKGTGHGILQSTTQDTARGTAHLSTGYSTTGRSKQHTTPLHPPLSLPLTHIHTTGESLLQGICTMRSHALPV